MKQIAMHECSFDPPASYVRIREMGILAHPLRLWNFDWMTDEARSNWQFPDFSQPTLPGLFPFAQDYTGDPYCWLQGRLSRFGEPDILLCDHEEGFAWLYAPSLAGAIFRTAATYAAAARESSVAPMVEMIEQVIKVYGDLLPDDWVQRLSLLAKQEPKIFRGAAVTKFSLHAPWDSTELIKQLFGSPYAEKNIQWANIAEQVGGGQPATRPESK
jgi:hypothetical protein